MTKKHELTYLILQVGRPNPNDLNSWPSDTLKVRGIAAVCIVQGTQPLRVFRGLLIALHNFIFDFRGVARQLTVNADLTAGDAIPAKVGGDDVDRGVAKRSPPRIHKRISSASLTTL